MLFCNEMAVFCMITETYCICRCNPTLSVPGLLPAAPTVVAQASASAPSFTYYTLGAVCAIVIVAILVVLLLGVVAYKRFVPHAHIRNQYCVKYEILYLEISTYSIFALIS